MIKDKEIYNRYIETLLKWQKSINLISDSTIDNLWERHFEDSLLLEPFLKNKKNIIDVGSGAGFPAMVLSIKRIKNITLIESDERKCIFLNQIKNLYNLDVKILNKRVETITDLQANVIIGRAFANLNNFIKLTINIINKNTEFFLLKGVNIKDEINIAMKSYNFDYKIIKVKNGNIIHIKNIIKL